MPLAAYFRYVGAALLVLLFVANFYLPDAPAVQTAQADPPTIRIHSDLKWPERVVFDMNSELIVTAKPVASSAENAASSEASGAPAIRSDSSAARDAFALPPRADSRPPQSLDQSRRQRKSRYAASMRRHAMQQMALAARQREFAWYAFRPW